MSAIIFSAEQVSGSLLYKLYEASVCTDERVKVTLDGIGCFSTPNDVHLAFCPMAIRACTLIQKTATKTRHRPAPQNLLCPDETVCRISELCGVHGDFYGFVSLWSEVSFESGAIVMNDVTPFSAIPVPQSLDIRDYRAWQVFRQELDCVERLSI